MPSDFNSERLARKKEVQIIIKNIESLQRTNILCKIERDRLNVVLYELYSLVKFWAERTPTN